ncbi:hypothetical protein I4U23_000445 [Adineta vaga]|nr:hypothetical protein I4U23_000445 [Adineta vaga]
MNQLRSSIPYEILHGIEYPSNITILFAYINYFPPPPPMFPGPPPYSSRTCSFKSFSHTLPNDHDRSSLHHLIPSIETTSLPSQTNVFSTIITTSTSSFYETLFSSNYLHTFLQNHLILIILLIISLFFLILLFILYVYYQRLQQRHLTSSNKFYYHLVPRHRKYRTSMNINEQNVVRLKNYLPTANAIYISTKREIHRKTSNETEEAL